MPLKELGKQEVVAPESKAAAYDVVVAALVAVWTGHCVVTVLNVGKAGVFCFDVVPLFGVKLVSWAKRTVLW